MLKEIDQQLKMLKLILNVKFGFQNFVCPVTLKLIFTFVLCGSIALKSVRCLRVRAGKYSLHDINVQVYLKCYGRQR